MRKCLLLIVSLFIMIGAFADDIVIDFATETQEWWGATYDEDTQTMICNDVYQGLSWYWWEGRSTATYGEFEIVVNPEASGNVQVVIQYLDDDAGEYSNSEAYYLEAGVEATLTCPINQDTDAFQQIALQGIDYIGSIQLISAVVKERASGDDDGDTDNDTDELPIDNDWDLASGWGSSYDGATHTITYEYGWAGRGWWFGDPDTKDCSEYDGVEVVLKTDIAATINLVVQYKYYPEVTDDDEDPEPLTTTGSITGSGTGEEQTLYCALDPDMADKVIQIWIQPAAGGEIELVSARFVKDSGEEPTPDPEPVEGENLWDAVEDGTAYEGVYEYWATGDSWDLIYEGTSTGNSGEYWSRDADAKTWTVTMPENAGGSTWQDQVHILTSLPVVGDTEYSFGCSILCDADGAATIKLVDSADDGDFFFDDLHTFVAGEVYNYVAQGVTMGDADSVKLVFDFAGTPGGAVITICNIAFNEGNELVDTGIEEVAPAAAPVAKKGIYNLAGQRVNANAKGLLIIDGKKVLVK